MNSPVSAERLNADTIASAVCGDLPRPRTAAFRRFRDGIGLNAWYILEWFLVNDNVIVLG